MRDTRARLTVTAQGTSLAQVTPLLDAQADRVMGPGRWHQHGPVSMTPFMASVLVGGTVYDASMDVIATDEDEVTGL